MTRTSRAEIPVGTVVHDNKGDAWVYVGFRVNMIGNHEHCFVKAWKGKVSSHATPVWEYRAVYRETLVKKFPDLDKYWAGGEGG